MYCDGRCEYLDEKKHRCKRTRERLAYMRQRGAISFTVHEHNSVCEHDEPLAQKKGRNG